MTEITDISERDIERMHDAELEYREIEARKTPMQKLDDLLKRHQYLLEECMKTCVKAEAELLKAKELETIRQYELESAKIVIEQSLDVKA